MGHQLSRPRGQCASLIPTWHLPGTAAVGNGKLRPKRAVDSPRPQEDFP